MKRMFRRLTRARTALIGMATVTVAVAITGVIAPPASAAALPSSGSGTSGSLTAHSKGGRQ